MRNITGVLSPLSSYQMLKDCISGGISPIQVTGVIDSQNVHLMAAVAEETNRPLLIVAENDIKAREIYENMYFFNKNIAVFDSRDLIFYSADVHSRETDTKRLSVLKKLINNEIQIVIVPSDAYFDKIIPPDILKESVLTIAEGNSYNIDDIINRLIYMGYERVEAAESPAQFSLRGGILDIYPTIADTAFRVEFWDDEVDSIRTMDPLTQRSVERTNSFEIYPVSEFFCDAQRLEKATENMEKSYKKAKNAFAKKGMADEEENLESHVGELIERLKNKDGIVSSIGCINYFYNETVNILGYMPQNTVVFFCEMQRIKQRAENLFKEFSESIKSRMEKGYILPEMANVIYDYTESVKMAESYCEVIMSSIAGSLPDFNIKSIVDFSVRSTESFNNKVEYFADEVKRLKESEYCVLILSSAESRGERIVRELYDFGIEAAFVLNPWEVDLKAGTVTVSRGNLGKGFIYNDIKFVVFSDNEFFDEKKGKKARKKKKNTKTIESFSDLKPGDYVVHSSHGIGVYRGIEKITVDGVNKDYVKVSYADGGNLFIPAGQMDCIQKYIGSDGIKVKLNKLGGQDWNKTKAKVRKSVEILAEDLVKLYAKRQAAKGFVYSPDNIWQREFEEMFPYDETDDQLNAIDEVKHDMETGRVMDRLICGDVGYGKTEVAIRAAFKAVQDSKQVAYLVPTTILAQQHYNTFVQRMKDYPVKIELLSRFRTRKQQTESIKRLETGMSDIVIGTHRILSKDVKFKDLGLVIIDEEQRFGVGHKEKLKNLKENLDVLTLTATPIPRTLHMSLSGIRDMSILEEPPRERRPVQTYVMENDSELIKDAINRELARNGQVYYLYNRVESISQEAMRIQNLVPDAVVAFAHGQMTERELEIIMKDFIEGEIDVLVCTTIIETGLDIGNVNTMIIQDADKMGLSQLYQLRGRVGRTNKTAYAYLMYKRDKVLNEVSEKRLQTIKEFTEFGSGFKIAMRDLEIRGAGNILGSQQHGHMDSVGYEMYCRLLDEAVKKLRGEKVQDDFETLIDVNLDAYIPSFYIKNEEQKLEIYKKIANISGNDDYYDIQEEIEDRYGNIPKSVQYLLEIALIKNRAHNLDIISVVQKPKSVLISFRGDADIDPSKITAAVIKKPLKYMFTAATNPYITVKINENDKKEVLNIIDEALSDIENAQ